MREIDCVCNCDEGRIRAKIAFRPQAVQMSVFHSRVAAQCSQAFSTLVSGSHHNGKDHHSPPFPSLSLGTSDGAFESIDAYT